MYSTIPEKQAVYTVEKIQGVQCRIVLVVNFYCIFEIKYFFFVVAKSDLVHEVITVFHFP